jgi:hypothetical protein
MSAADRLIGKAHDYEVLAASHSEREALMGAGSTSLLRLRSPLPRS